MSKNGVFKELKKSLFLKLFPQFIINQDFRLKVGFIFHKFHEQLWLIRGNFFRFYYWIRSELGILFNEIACHFQHNIKLFKSNHL